MRTASLPSRVPLQRTTVGVLAFQGGVEEHIFLLQKSNVAVKKVRTLSDLRDVTHLILPGGESTVMGKFLQQSGMGDLLKKRVGDHSIKLWGTCAGAILLGHKASPYSLNLIDVDLKRNAYGRQIDSFETEIHVPTWRQKFRGIFIRAPRITRVGDSVSVLSSVRGDPVLCADQNILLSTFHPELAGVSLIHEFFVKKF